MRQYSGQINQDKLDLDRKTKANKQASEELDNNAALSRALRKRDKDKGLEPGTSQQEWLKIREREILGDSAQPAPASASASTQQQQPRTIDISSIR
jgi:hypothetical protein